MLKERGALEASAPEEYLTEASKVAHGGRKPRRILQEL